MCDAGEEQCVRRGLAAAGFGSPRTRPEIDADHGGDPYEVAIGGEHRCIVASRH